MPNYTTDLHSLYESSVQNVEADIEFVDKTFLEEHGRHANLLREDFCGTASLAAAWVREREENRAWGVDLDEPTLEWGRQRRIKPLGGKADRVVLTVGNVLDVHEPKVEVQVAFNFSYFIFKTRPLMLQYFKTVRQSLLPGGLFFLDLFGGTESMCDLVEETDRDEATEPDGRIVPALTYIWEQESFNPVTHDIVCHISFRLKGKAAKGNKRKIRRAFTYDWRFWTIAELRELLEEAGFSWSRVYTEGWDEEDDEGDGNFELVEDFDNEGSWVSYLVAGTA